MANYDTVNGIYWLYQYHPYRGGFNRAFDVNSRLLLDSKDASCKDFVTAVQYFTRGTRRYINQYIGASTDFYVALAPSSTANKWSPGLCAIADNLRKNYKILNDAQMLTRHTTVAKAARGGSRDKEQHKKTISVSIDPSNKKPVALIIDDVTTSGSTMLACKELLDAAGFVNIMLLTLEKTG